MYFSGDHDGPSYKLFSIVGGITNKILNVVRGIALASGSGCPRFDSRLVRGRGIHSTVASESACT